MLEDIKKVSELALKGTTTVGVVFKSGVVLVADKRVTSGRYVAHRTAEKILKISDHMAVTIAGTVADAQNIVDVLKANVNLYSFMYETKMSVKAAANLVSLILFQNRILPYLVQVIVAGMDEAGPHIYVLDFFGNLTRENYCATGSGSMIAYGILEEGYKDNLTKEEAIKLCIRALSSAIKRDLATGDGIDCIVIDESGFHKFTPDDIRRIMEATS